MSKAEQIIKTIEEADEIEIMEFDFDPCFEYLRKMESMHCLRLRKISGQT